MRKKKERSSSRQEKKSESKTILLAETLSLKTNGFTDIVDITPHLGKIVQNSGVSSGLLTVSVPGATAGITAIEYESGLVEDLKKVFEKLVPEQAEYKHNEKWGDGNGFSHIRASLLGFSKSVPIHKAEMVLGTWQQLILVDFDNGPRTRELFVQIIGQ